MTAQQIQELEAPWPWFGGKRRAAPIVWDALGDPGGYVEPFAGSAAVLLSRPGWRQKGWRRVETLNDQDAWLCNTFRAIRYDPAGVAEHANMPMMEIELQARMAWLHQRRDDDLRAWLEGDPGHHDAKAAGWWLYVVAGSIAESFQSGPWRQVDGKMIKVGRDEDGNLSGGISKKLPYLGCAGRGVFRDLSAFSDDPEQDVREYMSFISSRLARVRITCGDWRRVLTPAASNATAGGDGRVAIFLDPPYITSGDLYTGGDAMISPDVPEWCKTAPKEHRVILAGFDDEHDELLEYGWRKIDGKSGSGSGYNKDKYAGRRERLWLSASCAGHVQETLI